MSTTNPAKRLRPLGAPGEDRRELAHGDVCVQLRRRRDGVEAAQLAPGQALVVGRHKLAA
jgi:hypothetical protein